MCILFAYILTSINSINWTAKNKSPRCQPHVALKAWAHWSQALLSLLFLNPHVARDMPSKVLL